MLSLKGQLKQTFSGSVDTDVVAKPIQFGRKQYSQEIKSWRKLTPLCKNEWNVSKTNEEKTQNCTYVGDNFKTKKLKSSIVISNVWK